MEKKMKHLELIQGIINRMAGNSFMLKGWAVTLISGIFVLAENETDKKYFLVAYIPIITFWILDAYYLFQEKLYRALYERIRLVDEDDTDFCLSATKEEYGSAKICFWKCLFSKTEMIFYFPLAIVCFGIIIITHI